MLLRRQNNAASAAFAVVLFVLVGCAVALCGVVAGFEAWVVKFGLVAYLVLAGPLLLASLSGRTARSKHKSFRATPPAYMEGKRVKRRLRLVACAGELAGLVVAGMTFFGGIAALGRFGFPPGQLWAVIIHILSLTIPVAAAYLAMVAFKLFCLKLGWMTPEEARWFPFRRRRWPDEWLEPIDQRAN